MHRRQILVGSLGLAVLLGAVGLSAGAGGGAPRTPAAQPEAEVVSPELAAHPIAKMVGSWRGTASRLGRTDRQWHAATGVERARWNLAGTAILVEGYGYIEDPDTDDRRVGHDAFGLIEWDEGVAAPVFYARMSGGEFEKFDIELVGDTGQIRWRLDPAPDVTMRFTVTLTDSRWHEVGEMSRDEGETWIKVMETDLKKVDE